MAAYAALASLMNTIQDIINHPKVSTFFENNHTQILLEKTSSLLDFMEANNYGEEAEDLEREIKFAAEAAEKVIDLHIMDQIYAETNLRQSLDLQQYIHDMDDVMKKANEFKGKQRSGEDQGARVLVPDTEIEETSMVELMQSWRAFCTSLPETPNPVGKPSQSLGWAAWEDHWIPINGEYLRLKFLQMSDSYLKYWDADNSHFPVLEKLVLDQMHYLKEIPLGIGDIPTLELIRIKLCNNSVAISALKIKENQLDNGNDSLQVQICVSLFRSHEEELKARAKSEGLSIRNIQFETCLY